MQLDIFSHSEKWNNSVLITSLKKSDVWVNCYTGEALALSET